MDAGNAGRRLDRWHFCWLDDGLDRLDERLRLLSGIFQSSEFPIPLLVFSHLVDFAVHVRRSLFTVCYTAADSQATRTFKITIVNSSPNTKLFE